MENTFASVETPEPSYSDPRRPPAGANQEGTVSGIRERRKPNQFVRKQKKKNEIDQSGRRRGPSNSGSQQCPPLRLASNSLKPRQRLHTPPVYREPTDPNLMMTKYRAGDYYQADINRFEVLKEAHRLLPLAISRWMESFHQASPALIVNAQAEALKLSHDLVNALNEFTNHTNKMTDLRVAQASFNPYVAGSASVHQPNCQPEEAEQPEVTEPNI